MKRKKILVILLSLVLVVAFCGCGNSKSEELEEKVAGTISEEVEKEELNDMQQNTEEKAENIDNSSENEIKDTVDKEEINQPEEADEKNILHTEDIWEDVKETDKICIVIMDENGNEETLLYSKGTGASNCIPYIIKQNVKIYVPLRDNINGIHLVYCDGNSDSKALYTTDSVGVDYNIKDMGNGVQAIMIDDAERRDFNIIIHVSDYDEYIYFLIGYDNQ